MSAIEGLLLAAGIVAMVLLGLTVICMAIYKSQGCTCMVHHFNTRSGTEWCPQREAWVNEKE